jgi:hypothetical protein
MNGLDNGLTYRQVGDQVGLKKDTVRGVDRRWRAGGYAHLGKGADTWKPRAWHPEAKAEPEEDFVDLRGTLVINETGMDLEVELPYRQNWSGFGVPRGKWVAFEDLTHIDYSEVWTFGSRPAESYPNVIYVVNREPALLMASERRQDLFTVQHPRIRAGKLYGRKLIQVWAYSSSRDGEMGQK